MDKKCACENNNVVDDKNTSSEGCCGSGSDGKCECCCGSEEKVCDCGSGKFSKDCCKTKD